jgi:ribonuclease HI
MPAKFYAVRKGRRVGIFLTWPDCQKQVSGFSGAQFKSFSTEAEAETYLHTSGKNEVKSTSQVKPKSEPKTPAKFGPILLGLTGTEVQLNDNFLTIYADGSFKDNKSGSACFFPPSQKVHMYRPSGKQTNNTGELYAVWLAFQVYTEMMTSSATADVNNPTASHLLVRTDSLYSINGITGRHQAHVNQELIQDIQMLMLSLQTQFQMRVYFQHVSAHSGIFGNEVCDVYADLARDLSEGQTKIKPVQDHPKFKNMMDEVPSKPTARACLKSPSQSRSRSRRRDDAEDVFPVVRQIHCSDENFLCPTTTPAGSYVGLQKRLDSAPVQSRIDSRSPPPRPTTTPKTTRRRSRSRSRSGIRS